MKIRMILKIIKLMMYIISQVVPGTRRGRSFEKGTWLIGIHGELQRSELKWNEMHVMNELTWINWQEWFDMQELKRMNWNEWIVMSELKRMNWKEWIDMTDLSTSSSISGKNSSWTIFMWNRTLATVSCTFCRPHLQHVFRARQFVYDFYWSTTWWWCGRQMQWRSRYSRAHTLPTSWSTWSSKSGKKLNFERSLREIHQALAKVSCTFCRPHLQKVLWARKFFLRFLLINYLMTMWSTDAMTLSLQSRTLCRPHLQKVLWARKFFYDFYWSTTWWRCGRQMQWRSRCSRAHFVDLIFKKWSEVASSLRFLCEIELSLQSRAHFVDHFPDRGAKPRKQRPSSSDHGQPLYPKIHRVLRPRVFAAVNSHVPDRPHFPTPWWWCDWHDDVVDMMVRQLIVRIVRSSEVS